MEGVSRLLRYKTHLPLLCISLIFWGVLYYIFTRIHPDQVRDLVIPYSFVTVVIPFFIATTSFFSYLFLHTSVGLILGTSSALLLFLKLQMVVFEWQWLTIGVVITLLLLKMQLNSHTETQQQSIGRRQRILGSK